MPGYWKAAPFFKELPLRAVWASSVLIRPFTFWAFHKGSSITGWRRFTAFLLALHLFLHCEINIFCCAWWRCQLPHTHCVLSLEKYFLGNNSLVRRLRLEKWSHFPFLSLLIVKWQSCEVLLLCSAAVAAKTNTLTLYKLAAQILNSLMACCYCTGTWNQAFFLEKWHCPCGFEFLEDWLSS